MLGCQAAFAQSISNGHCRIAGLGIEFLDIMRRVVKGYFDMCRSRQGASIIDNGAHHIRLAQYFRQLQFSIDSVLPADNCHSGFVEAFNG